MRPIIGLNLDITASQPDKASIDLDYPNAILAAGGVPLFLYPGTGSDVHRLVGILDGLVLIGGDDYDPSFYCEPVSAETKVGIRQRQEFDYQLAKYVIEETNLPVLGICAGCQMTNIVLGGTLIQHIPSHAPDSSVKHSDNDGTFGSHEIFLNEGTQLSKIYGTQHFHGPTWHHQAVNRTGKGLRVAAHAADGIIEAVESSDSDRFLVGVQWHPERDLDGHLCLFKKFISVAQSRKQPLISASQSRLATVVAAGAGRHTGRSRAFSQRTLYRASGRTWTSALLLWTSALPSCN